MLRRCCNALAIAALLASIGLSALWVRSFYVADYAHLTQFERFPTFELERTWHVSSRRGGLKLDMQTDHCVLGTSAKIRRWRYGTSRADYYPFFGTISLDPRKNHWTPLQQAGFDFHSSATPSTPPEIVKGFIIPHWFAVTVFLIPSTLWFHRRIKSLRRERRQRKGLCPACGYDLRESPARCPECGNEIKPATPSQLIPRPDPAVR
jgi:hypothetical protein